MLKRNATDTEKSLALAKLVPDIYNMYTEWQPYSNNRVGLAQFADILLKNFEVVLRFRKYDSGAWDNMALMSMPEDDLMIRNSLYYRSTPTQSNILDEVLRMTGGMK